jgi:hypothetical protein
VCGCDDLTSRLHLLQDFWLISNEVVRSKHVFIVKAFSIFTFGQALWKIQGAHESAGSVVYRVAQETQSASTFRGCVLICMPRLSYVRILKLRDAKLSSMAASARSVTPRRATEIASRTRPPGGLSDNGVVRFGPCHDKSITAKTGRSVRPFVARFS